MTDQPPVLPPHQPPQHPAGAPTQAMPAAPVHSAGMPPGAPRTSVWRQATSTRRRRLALAAGAFAVAVLTLLGLGLVGFAALRVHDRVSLMADRGDGFSRGHDGPDNSGGGHGPDGRYRPDMPGIPDGRGPGPGGLGSLMGALHGDVTATVNGSVQALKFQRGEVTALSATSITLKSSDGFVGTFGRTGETVTRWEAPVKGGQAFVVARQSDKVAITILSMPAGADVAPSS